MMYDLYIMKTQPSLARTQIYLTQAQQAGLALACRGSAASKSELIRRAIDQFLDQTVPSCISDKVQRLNSFSGLWSQREEMADPDAYVRQLRAPRF